MVRTNSVYHLNARIILFRRALDEEVKDGKRDDLHLKGRNEEKKAGSDGM